MIKKIMIKDEILAKIESVFSEIENWNGEDIHFGYFIALPNVTEEDPQPYKLENIIARAEEGDTLEDVKKAVIDYMMNLESPIYSFWGYVE